MAAMYMSHSDSLAVAMIMAKLQMEPENESIWRDIVGRPEISNTDWAMTRMLQPNMKSGLQSAVNLITVGEEGYGRGIGAQGLKSGGDTFIWRQMMQLTGKGVAGDSLVEGTGSIASFRDMRMYVNRMRHETIVRIGRMNDVRAGNWAVAAAKQAGPVLNAWRQRWLSWYGINWALLRKYSWHIEKNGAYNDYPTGSLAVGGAHHPNFLCLGLPIGTGNGYMESDWSATDATYEAAIAKNIMRVESANPDCHMNYQNLGMLNQMCSEKRIQPINLGGKTGWILLLHPDQHRQLKKDSEYIQAMKTGVESSDMSKVLQHNYSGFIEGFHIFHGFGAACEVFAHYSGTAAYLEKLATSANANMIDYGCLLNSARSGETYAAASANGYRPAYKDMTDVTVNRSTAMISSAYAEARNKRLGIVLGANALNGVRVGDMRSMREDYDYKNKEAMDIDFIESYGRCDWMYDTTAGDNLSSPTSVVNNSSLVFVTASPSYGQ